MMRLYCKLAALALIACTAQAALSSGVVGETYFAVRCLAATTANDRRLEAALIGECEKQLVAERRRARTAVALNAASEW